MEEASELHFWCYFQTFYVIPQKSFSSDSIAGSPIDPHPLPGAQSYFQVRPHTSKCPPLSDILPLEAGAVGEGARGWGCGRERAGGGAGGSARVGGAGGREHSEDGEGVHRGGRRAQRGKERVKCESESERVIDKE